ncbi:MAG: type II secretion system protein [Planctomycetota bacterium]
MTCTPHAKRPGTARPRRSGFTLVELLVVVSIIALLVAMLLPSLTKARKQSQAVVCLSRQQQLGVGMTMYFTEYDVYPPHQLYLDTGDAETGEARERVRWYNAMAALLNTDKRDKHKVQSCPAVYGWKVGRNNSYGYNYKYLGSCRINQDGRNPYAPYERFPVKTVRSPSATIAFADCDGTGWTLEHRDEFDLQEDWKNPLRLGNHGYTLDPTFVPLWSDATYSGPPGGTMEQETYAWKNWRTYLSDRHLGQSAAVFADGHGEMVVPRTAYQDNSMWNGLGMDPALLRDDPTLPGKQDTAHPLYLLDPHVPVKLSAASGQLWRY